MIKATYLTSQDDSSEVMLVRQKVFVEEQGYSQALERDRFDDMSVYALAKNEQGEPVATGRLFIDDDDNFTVGRVCAIREYRGQGYADLVMRMLLYRALDLGATMVVIHSQLPAMPFYERYGFHAEGDMEYDEGVPHRLLVAKREEIRLEGSCSRHSKASETASHSS